MRRRCEPRLVPPSGRWPRACWSWTITPSFAPGWPTSSTRSPTCTWSPKPANGADAVTAYDQHHPDVTLLDLRMPVMEGVEAVRRIRERDPQAKVIVLTTYDTDEDISRALRAGAKAYVLKDITAEALVTCIHDVLAGKTYLAPAAAAKLAEGVTRVQLTPRELATLRLMADGKSNKEIAHALGISDRTVKTHLGHLFEKLASPAEPKR